MRVLITGSSSGIGAAIAEELLNQGWEVHGIDCMPSQVSGLLEHNINLNQLDNVFDFSNAIPAHFDAFIHSAGIREICHPCELSKESWLEVMNINVNSAFILSQGLIKQAIAKNKALSIVNIASISGLQAEPNRAAYVSSKFALIGLTKQLAYQFGSMGIRTNAIAPGVIETPLTAQYFDDAEMVQKLKRNIPLGHWGTTQDILPLIQLCLTNTYMNGSVLVCDGGWTAGKEL